ncbi:SPRY domain-containing protein 3 isoform X2 [Chelonia mydas]|uniref:SPRY domain-containing protein 3 isoform X2 n=1 Tax=Chelonia mydas TaxID=8469 RepID=UPI001CA9CE14|nr:SPRY domain-containing protein 3 isoform X2 [Chelonia mydas]
MDDLNLHYRFLNWRRRIREIREVRAVRYQERFKHILVDGDTLSYHGNSGEVGCYVAPRPLTKDNNYFEVSIVDSGVRGTIAVGLVPQYYSLDHQPGWLPDSVAYHADDGKLYNGRAKGRQFGTKCSSGDRIGCGIEPVSFEVQTAQIFFTKNGKRVGSTIMPLSPDGLFPAVGMHSLGEEVRLHLHAELGNEEDDSIMMVDSYEDEWGRLHDVKVCGTDYPKNRHPGWSRGSVAYHAGADTGRDRGDRGVRAAHPPEYAHPPSCWGGRVQANNLGGQGQSARRWEDLPRERRGRPLRAPVLQGRHYGLRDHVPAGLHPRQRRRQRRQLRHHGPEAQAAGRAECHVPAPGGGGGGRGGGGRGRGGDGAGARREESGGILHTQREDHWQEGRGGAGRRLLPHHWHAEQWGESQGGPPPAQRLGARGHIPSSAPLSGSAPSPWGTLGTFSITSIPRALSLCL